jgi:hypothetical protein
MKKKYSRKGIYKQKKMQKKYKESIDKKKKRIDKTRSKKKNEKTLKGKFITVCVPVRSRDAAGRCATPPPPPAAAALSSLSARAPGDGKARERGGQRRQGRGQRRQG